MGSCPSGAFCTKREKSLNAAERVRKFCIFSDAKLAAPSSEAARASETRTIAVARLPALVQLNGSEVRPKERLEAEKTYLRRVLRWVQCELRVEMAVSRWLSSLHRVRIRTLTDNADGRMPLTNF